jgi:hypothetical protein
MTRGLLALTLAALCLHTVHAQPAPLDGTCAYPGTCPLGVTYALRDGSTVTVWDADATGDPAPDPGTVVFAVSVTICASAHPSPDTQHPAETHVVLLNDIAAGHPLYGLYGWDSTTVIAPGTCYAGWLAFALPRGRLPATVSYFETACTANAGAADGFAFPDCFLQRASGFWNIAG